MKLRRVYWQESALLLALLTGAAYGYVRQQQRDRPPNFVIIFCDDLGYGDIGPYGSKKNRTPHLDRMAAEGMKFTDFYVTSGLCTPSRASLMTGCYPRRVGLHENSAGARVLYPGDDRGLNPSEITIAELLKQRGYATAIVGKWHLGDQPEFLPTRQGFDQFFGIPFSNNLGAGFGEREFPPLPLLRNEDVVETDPDQSLLTKRFTEESIQFMRRHRNEPFLLYLPHPMPHMPVFASEAFLGKSANGLYGDTIEELDWSVGQIIATAKELGIDEQTMIVFLSDNGTSMQWGGSNAPLRGYKGSTYEGGMRVPCLIRWPGRVPAGAVCSEMATSMDFYPTLARLAGATIPRDWVIDGKDVGTLLAGEAGAKTPHDRFYYYRGGFLEAVRSSQWKLRRSRSVNESDWALYDLRDQFPERENLAAENQTIPAKLKKLLEEARFDLGDDTTGALGQNTRPAAIAPNPRTLTQ